MARLEGGFCAKTADLKQMVSEGQVGEARERAIGVLRSGYSSAPFLRFVADLLAADTPRGRPPGSKDALAYYEQFKALRAQGEKIGAAVGTIADKHGKDEGTIRRAIKPYRDMEEGLGG